MTRIIRCAAPGCLVQETLKLLRGPSVALSGGSTYAGLFPGWVAAGVPEGLRFFPVDERVLPIDHPDSNWGAARRLLLEPLGRPADVEHLATSAAQYSALLRERVGDPPVFDSVFLGVGEDGHTASLFPGGPELDDRLSPVLETESPRGPRRRVTLGLAALWAARSLVTVATGACKRPAVARLLAGDQKLPITLALQGHPAPVLVLERSADPGEGQATERQPLGSRR